MFTNPQSLVPNPHPLKILYLQTTGQIGGTEMSNFRTWRDRPDVLDIDVCILKDLFEDIGDVSRMYREHGYVPVHLNAENRPISQTRRHFTQLVHANQYDLIHAFGLTNNLLARTVRLPQKTKIITGQRSIDPWRTPMQNWLDRLTIGRVSHFISNSLAAEKWLHDTFGIAQTKTTTVHTGIDPTPFIQPKSSQLRRQLGIADEDVVAVTAANFVPAKAHDLLLESMGEVVRNGRLFHLLLAGEGPQKEALQARAAELGLQDTVHFLGFRTDMPDVYANADIKILPTNWEGLPNAVLEAMAAGLPVIGSDVGGVGELIEHQETGFLVVPNSVSQLAKKLATLVNDRSLRERMGRSGRERVRQMFDPVTQMGQLSAVYHQVNMTKA